MNLQRRATRREANARFEVSYLRVFWWFEVSRRRYLSTDISIDAKVNSLSDQAALLFTWAIPHFTDDCRISPRNAAEFKLLVVPGRDWTTEAVQKAIDEIMSAGLWGVEENGTIFVKADSFYKYQTYINAAKHRKTPKITAKHRETPQNASSPSPSPSPKREYIYVETPQNAEEHRKTPKNTAEQDICRLEADVPVTVKTTQEPAPETINVKELVESWNDFFENKLPCVEWPLSKSRELKARQRLKEHPTVNFWQAVLDEIASSDFLLGLGSGNRNGHEKWRCTFDFIIQNDTNCVKIKEGNYRRK